MYYKFYSKKGTKGEQHDLKVTIFQFYYIKIKIVITWFNFYFSKFCSKSNFEKEFIQIHLNKIKF
jgi:hypothetical protein